MASSITLTTTAEALAVCSVAGLDPGVFVGLVSDSGAASVSPLSRRRREWFTRPGGTSLTTTAATADPTEVSPQIAERF